MFSGCWIYIFPVCEGYSNSVWDMFNGHKGCNTPLCGTCLIVQVPFEMTQHSQPPCWGPVIYSSSRTQFPTALDSNAITPFHKTVSIFCRILNFGKPWMISILQACLLPQCWFLCSCLFLSHTSSCSWYMYTISQCLKGYLISAVSKMPICQLVYE